MTLPSSKKMFIRFLSVFVLFSISPMFQAPSSSTDSFLMRNLPIPSDGIKYKGVPSVVSPGNGNVHMFVRGNDNAIWHRYYNGEKWSGWGSLGGYLTSAPSAVSYRPGYIHIYAKGGDNAIYQKFHNGKKWSGWGSLGGKLTSAPSAVSYRPGQIHVFAKGGDNAIYQKFYNGKKWSGWSSLGGKFTSAPSAVVTREGYLTVIGKGSNNAMYHKALNQKTWLSWKSLGGKFTSEPSAFSLYQDTFIALGKRDDTLYQGVEDYSVEGYSKLWEGPWSGWERARPAPVIKNTPGYIQQIGLSTYAEGLLVRTKRGRIRIEDVKVGDYVLSMIPKYEQYALIACNWEWKKVIGVFSGIAPTIVETKTTDGTVIRSTILSQIPSYEVKKLDNKIRSIYRISAKNYLDIIWAPTYEAKKLLHNSSKRYLIDVGNDLKIRIKSMVIKKGKFKVVGLAVEDNHNFVVGKNDILVHNDKQLSYAKEFNAVVPGIGSVSGQFDTTGTMRITATKDFNAYIAACGVGATTSFNFKTNEITIGAVITARVGQFAKATVETGITVEVGESVSTARAYIKTTGSIPTPGGSKIAYSWKREVSVLYLMDTIRSFSSMSVDTRGAGSDQGAYHWYDTTYRDYPSYKPRWAQFPSSSGNYYY